MSDEHRSADDPAPRTVPCDEERRLARKALAGHARNADDLSLLMDMLGLDPSRDPDHEVAYGQERGRGREHGGGPGKGRGAGRERRPELRRDARPRWGGPRA
ncbi:hypothetical protein OHU45_03330 [Streptomyces tubercidicus]|uniref:hypothetical protein n=1 Tax=Streptomyces tubercidicus TaxID=47759 RepID=UPI002E1178E8|nr:hypothetical protein OG761_03150 [Streptomyces tubercidicus]WSX24368.1 hypothetical protein OG690_34185 [Streptomyces tubercidicus]